MTLDEILALNGAELAHMADVSAPNTINSSGAQFLYEVRKQYIELRDALHSDEEATVDEALDKMAMTDAGTTYGCVPHPTGTLWQVFTDLAVWQNDYYEPELFGKIEWENISNVPEVALGEVVRYLGRELLNRDNGRPAEEEEGD